MKRPAYVYAGAVAPAAFALTVDPIDGVDLSTATGFVFNVRKPNGAETTWAATTTQTSATGAVVTHVFAAGDVDLPGTYSVFVSFAIAGGTLRTDTIALAVIERFALSSA